MIWVCEAAHYRLGVLKDTCVGTESNRTIR